MLRRAIAEEWPVDLHTHSRHSDGAWTPRELVDLAVTTGIGVLALTDHDTVDGQAELAEAAARAGVMAISGIEVTTRLGERDFHLLCYGLDPRESVWSEIARRRRSSRQPLPIAELGRMLGSSAALLSIAHPGREERRVSHRLGDDDLSRMLELLPLAALEAHHPFHAPLDVAYYRDVASRLGLAVTCGSDAHGWGGRRLPVAHDAALARDFLERVADHCEGAPAAKPHGVVSTSGREPEGGNGPRPGSGGVAHDQTVRL